MHDDLPAEQGAFVRVPWRLGDNAIKTVGLRLVKAACLQPGLKTALSLLVPCGAHR